ncbi:MAG: hypothetical protein ACQETH_13540 [Candidatus Rifleibacteriota bacterium]
MHLKKIWFSIIFVSFVFALLVPPIFAWDVPDKCWISESFPPKYWKKSGSLEHKGRHALQCYKLYSPGEVYENIFVYVAIWPVSDTDRFGVKVFAANIKPEEMPQSCSEPAPEDFVNMQITLKLIKMNPLD